ncbi:GNAT family N-acetyltransferase [Staphylococcus casei]|uniref:GNAT family N-acetyltransferase n=1 Tax=Staphylococcus casei TaxID=201828 RepID=UPI001304D96B|nr:GNAT family N-acetyltransferase [Staphylococcus casei]WJE87550.1 GNAT family N-acetyltransferase [Staphylococcus casei]
MTKRLIMVKPDLKYADELFDIHSDLIATQFTPLTRHLTIEDTNQMIRNWMRYWDENHYGYFIFIDRCNGKVLGSGGAMKKAYFDDTFLNIYYRIRPSYTGKGLAYEAMNKVINWLKSNINDKSKFIIRTDKNNVASIKLAKKLNFQYRSTRDNHSNYEDIFYIK